MEDVTNSKSFQEKVDDLLKVLNERSEGVSNDDDVEELLQTNFQLTTTTTTTTTTIVEDDENYDTIDTNQKDETTTTTRATRQTKVESVSKRKKEEPKWTGGSVPIPSLQQQQQQQQSNNGNGGKLFDKSEEWNALESVALGKTGARMMVTFGDGPNPTCAAVQTALLAVRNCLQNAIKDARALRRQQKEEFERAKMEYSMYRQRQSDVTTHIANHQQSTISSFLRLFSNKRDKMSAEPSCGFDDSQLQTLFPEEMHAYKRWRSMKKAYDSSKDTKGGGEDEDESTNKDPNSKKENGESKQDSNDNNTNTNKEEEEEEEEEEEVTPLQGHLEDRLAQFDARTEQMKEEWYMAFTEVRQGSFLPKQADIMDKQWDEHRNSGKKIKMNKKTDPTTWESLPASSVQFLHWVGFEPRSALPPPNEETTQALAFLGYDFMGKIIEKAIFLRCFHKMEQQRATMKHLPQQFMLQLRPNEQLTNDDVETALNDSTVISKPLYHATHSVLQNAEAAQLYFGPGFEERIEMEMDQMLLGHKLIKKLSHEEQQIRIQEDELFKQLKQPPKLLNDIMDVLSTPPVITNTTTTTTTTTMNQSKSNNKDENKSGESVITSSTTQRSPSKNQKTRSRLKSSKQTCNSKVDTNNDDDDDEEFVPSKSKKNTTPSRKRSRSSSSSIGETTTTTTRSTRSTPQRRRKLSNVSSPSSSEKMTARSTRASSEGIGKRTRSHGK